MDYEEKPDPVLLGILLGIKTNTVKIEDKDHEPKGETSSGIKRKPTTHDPESEYKNMKKAVDSLFCEICEVGCSSAITLGQHLKGRKHKAKKEFRKLKKVEGDSEEKPMCNVCQIWCSDANALQMHFKGHKHKARLEASGNSQGGGEERSNNTVIECGVCQVVCMNEELYQMHLKGKKHRWEDFKRLKKHA